MWKATKISAAIGGIISGLWTCKEIAVWAQLHMYAFEVPDLRSLIITLIFIICMGVLLIGWVIEKRRLARGKDKTIANLQEKLDVFW